MRGLSLLQRFALISAVLISALGFALAAISRAAIERRATEHAEQTAAVVADFIVGARVPSDVFADGLAPGERALMNHRMRAIARDQLVQAALLFSPDGTVLWDSRHDDRGERVEIEEGLRTALAGRRWSEIEEGEHADGDEDADVDLADVGQDAGRLVEVYVPVTADDGPVVGAFELHLPYEPIAQNVNEDVRRLSVGLAVGLGTLFLALFRTVATASRRLRSQAEENRRLAYEDTLTTLPNRALFQGALDAAVERAHATHGGMAVVLLNLDRFRDINDTLGHHIGDLLLAQVGDRLREQLRQRDTVARLGGDEFAMLLDEIGAPDAAMEVAERLLSALEAPFEVGEVCLEIGASAGVACYPLHANSSDALLQSADVAMYAAKTTHSRTSVYTAENDPYTPERLSLFGELRRGIDAGELVLHYQPQLDVVGGRVSEVEALVRWQHPQRGLLGPHEFVEMAEHTGLIRPLTIRVLELALAQCARWRDEGRGLRVAVNLSARSLVDPELPELVARLLVQHGLRGDDLSLELTESSVMVDPARARSVLERLHAQGIRIAIDDFGTGHSSLAYLRALPVDTLKIDKSFVLDMDSSEGNAVIVRSTIDLARNLGFSVVAEGVETAAVLGHLRVLGCRSAQGFYLARPVPADELPGVVASIHELVEERPSEAVV